MKKAAVVLGVIIALVLLFTQTKLGALLQTGDLDQISQYIKSFGLLSIVISFLLIVVQTFIPFVPFFLLAGVNIVIFGPVGGFLLTWIAAVVGASLNFLTARYVAQGWAQAKVGNLPFFQRLNEQAERSGFRIVLMARLIPVLPSTVINAAAGLSAVSFLQFFTATLIGKFPITLLEAIVGHDIFNFSEHKIRFFVVLGLLGLLMWGGSKLGKAYERRAEAQSQSRLGRDNPDGMGERDGE